MTKTIPLTWTIKETQKRDRTQEYYRGFWILTCGEAEAMLMESGELFIQDKSVGVINLKDIGLDPQDLR